MNADNEEAVHSDWPEAPTSAAELYIVLQPATEARDAALAATGHAIRPWRIPGLFHRWAQDRSHGRTADAPDDAVLAAFYLAAEQAPQSDEPSYHVDRGLQRFSAWLDDQIEP
jgi:hypothetical protein